MSFDDLLVHTAVLVLTIAGGWSSAVLLTVIVEASSAGRFRPARWTGAPDWLYRPLLALVTAAVASCGIASPGHAAGQDPPRGPDDADRAGLLVGLRLPDRPLGAVAAAPSMLTVAPGDSLWRIATRLAPGADPAATATAVAALYRHNHDVIGGDPDLLHPGQRLRVPAGLDDQETT